MKTRPKYFFEIGAFDAKFSREAKIKLPDCSFCAFEANPYNFNLFKGAVEEDGVDCIHLAIGDSAGKIKFNLQKSVNGQSVHAVRGNNSILKRVRDNVDYEEIEVPVNTIDNLFFDAVMPDESLAIWIDVEGYAHEVLSGAVKILGRTSMVFVEVESQSYWKNQRLDVDVIEFMMNNGFVPVARDFEYEGQYNLIFLKRDIFRSSIVQEELFKFFSTIKCS
ncbi:hypothetical protein RF819_20580 [Rhodoferax fermentans]|uniref:Methyltransferase FkbM domain-containing protein n=1 Tax=Rhodoferax fermentans TaxID=28066 RepID=A0A1T1AXR0_RHOFE|nr:hypothetical protein RF819_20580 [Rhodoferax fermentans]